MDRTALVDLDGVRRRLGGESDAVLAVVDEHLEGAPIVDAVTGGTGAVEWVGAVADLDTVGVVAERVRRAGHVVAIGGGRTIDCVKLGVAVAANPPLHEVVAGFDDGGSLYLHDGSAHDVGVIAVPTTLGTGAEQSQSAVIDNASGRTIVGSPHLRPGAAFVDSLATRGLPRDLVLSGVYEAIVRVVGPGAGSDRSDDDLSLASASRLAVLGSRLAECASPGGTEGDDERHEVGRLSGLGHGPAMHRNRGPSSFPAWSIATEVSWWTGLEKAAAMAFVLPGVWARALSGDTAWGSEAGIVRLWTAIVSAVTQTSAAVRLPDDPAIGLRVLADTWGVTASVPPIDTVELASRIERRWGPAGHLGGLGSWQIDDLLSDAADQSVSSDQPEPSGSIVRIQKRVDTTAAIGSGP